MSMLRGESVFHRKITAVDSAAPNDDGTTVGAWNVPQGFDHVMFSLVLTTSGTAAFVFKPYWWDKELGQWFTDAADAHTVGSGVKGNLIFTVPRQTGRVWLLCSGIDAGGDAKAMVYVAPVKTKIA